MDDTEELLKEAHEEGLFTDPSDEELEAIEDDAMREMGDERYIYE